MGVPNALCSQERRCAARADPYWGEALRLLHVPNALQPEGRRCAARADPHGGEAVRLLHVPNALLPGGPSCAARADPHRALKSAAATAAVAAACRTPTHSWSGAA